MALGTQPFGRTPVASLWVFDSSLSDTLVVSESISKIFQTNISDNLTIAEIILKLDNGVISDTLSLSETASYILIRLTNLSVSDSVVITEDPFPGGSTFNRSISDTLTLSESMHRLFNFSLIQSINIIETIGILLNKTIFVNDSVNIIEGITGVQAIKKILDTIVLTHSVAVHQSIRNLSLHDNLVLSDSVVVRLLPLEKMVDNILVGENIHKRLLPGSPIIDNLSIKEVTSVAQILNITVTDCLALYDFCKRVRTASASDTVVITEALNKFFFVSDTLRIVDSVLTNAIFDVCGIGTIPHKSPLTDNINLVESLGLSKVLNIHLTESITPLDTVMFI